jgi:iron complex outermembrane receptor protein
MVKDEQNIELLCKFIRSRLDFILFHLHLYKMKKARLTSCVALLFTPLFAQHLVSGSVTNAAGEPLIGVNIAEKGTSYGTITDYDGNFRMLVTDSTSHVVFSYVGYNTIDISISGRSTIDLVMTEGIDLSEVQVVGSRSYRRSTTDSPAGIDVININELATTTGKVEINQILQFAAPSFNATKQSGSDGADHIDPASLRGLGPDQTLVLVNGKRRHQSSLINVFGTRGRKYRHRLKRIACIRN